MVNHTVFNPEFYLHNILYQSPIKFPFKTKIDKQLSLLHSIIVLKNEISKISSNFVGSLHSIRENDSEKKNLNWKQQAQT